MSKVNHINLKNRNAEIAAGIDKHIPSAITLGGTSYTPAALKAVFASQSAALDASAAAHKQWLDLVQAATGAGTTANAVYALLRGYVISQFGKDANAIFNDFGMTPPKVGGAKTVQTKTEAAAKRAATRAARHTMGSQQKKAVKGDVTGVVVTPVVAAPSSPAPASPAPTASGGTPPAANGASPTTAPHAN